MLYAVIVLSVLAVLHQQAQWLIASSVLGRMYQWQHECGRLCGLRGCCKARPSEVRDIRELLGGLQVQGHASHN
jgi:hypothetical protein